MKQPPIRRQRLEELLVGDQTEEGWRLDDISHSSVNEDQYHTTFIINEKAGRTLSFVLTSTQAAIAFLDVPLEKVGVVIHGV